MCLLNSRKVDKPYDMTGYKVAYREQLYWKDSRLCAPIASGPAGPVFYDRDTWMQAEFRRRVLEHEYGFHAYRTREDARQALRCHVRLYGKGRAVLIRVELADVFEEGYDASFESTETLRCVAARAMRIIRIVR